jgi:hypothetical protein
MIHYQWYESGRLFGIRYTFDDSGEALPTHAHEPVTLHNIVVLAGAIRLDGPEIEARQGFSGHVLDFDGTKVHTVTALAPKTVILNLFLSGKPPEYETLPDKEKHGVLGGLGAS